MSLSFLGAGNMASAMVSGILAGKKLQPAELACYSGSGRTAATLAERTGIAHATSLEALLNGADAVVIAFKPQHLASADPRLAELTAGKLVISILAGKRLATLAKIFPRARNLVWAMPNTPGQIGAGMTGFCTAQPLSPSDRNWIETLLGALGKFIEVPEDQMDALTAISGSGPAYLFQFAAHLRDAGVVAGLPRDTAYQLALETLLGASRLLARSGLEPEQLRDQVTSPNGVTMAGLKRAAELNFDTLVKELVLAAKARSIELSK